MARCQLLVGLCVIHLCFALAYQGFEYDPRLIPQATPPAYYPPPNPYAQYPSYQYPAPSYYPPQPGYPSEMYGDPENAALLEESQETTATASATGATTPTTTNTATGGNTANVQTPPQTSPEPSASTGSTNTMDAVDLQLAAALEAVKTDMVSKGKEVLEEKQWTDDVKSIITQYQQKISNVYANIETLKAAMATLYRKKQQIINAQIQKSLTSKLSDAKSDLSTVQAALDKVTNTQMEFEQSKKDIQSTIDSIFAQLAELKGEPASTGSAGGGTGSSSNSNSNSNSNSQSSTDTSSSFTQDPDSEIADKTAEINSKIDTIKSIVDALNAGQTSSSSS